MKEKLRSTHMSHRIIPIAALVVAACGAPKQKPSPMDGYPQGREHSPVCTVAHPDQWHSVPGTVIDGDQRLKEEILNIPRGVPAPEGSYEGPVNCTPAVDPRVLNGLSPNTNEYLVRVTGLPDRINVSEVCAVRGSDLFDIRRGDVSSSGAFVVCQPEDPLMPNTDIGIAPHAH